MDILVWNLRTFGTGNNNYIDLRTLTLELSIDSLNFAPEVIVVQELIRNGVQDLPGLTRMFEAKARAFHNNQAINYHFDWVKGAINRFGQYNLNNLQFNDLGWIDTAHGEGYAVIYRQGYLQAWAGNTDSGGVDNNQNTGRQAGNTMISVVRTVRQLQLANNGNGIPPYRGDARANALTENLALPSPTSSTPGTRVRDYVFAGNQLIPIEAWNKAGLSERAVRRPVMLQATDPQNNINASGVVFHAPEKSPPNFQASGIAMASLNVCPTVNRSFFAGDLNLGKKPADTNDNQSDYTLFNNFATQQMAQPGYTGVTVPGGTSVDYGASRNAYFGGVHAIRRGLRDLAYVVKPVQNPPNQSETTIIDLTATWTNIANNNSALMRFIAAIPARNILTMTRNTIQAIDNTQRTDNTGTARTPRQMFNRVYNPNSRVNMLQSDVNAVGALLYRMFVTDHLPVRIHLQ